MSTDNDNCEFKWGEVDFCQTRKFDLATVKYTIVPYGFLVQDTDNSDRVFMFESFAALEYYFTDHSKPKF